MAYFIRTEQDHTERDRVVFIHYKPELLSDQDKEGGYMVDELPTAPEPQKKKDSVMYREADGSLFWELVDRPPTQEEQFEDMQVQLTHLEEMVQQLLDAQS